MSDAPPEAIIVDSSALISLLVDTDANHERAKKMANAYTFTISKIAIPHDVFTECINILGKKINHRVALACAQQILESAVFFIVDPDDSLRQVALEKFKEMPERVSYTDCIVMALADLWKTRYIFGFDEIFAKEGYSLPASS